MVPMTQAVQYVRTMEAGYEDYPATEILGVGVQDGEALVITNNGEWLVWFTEGGRIYGEH